MKKKKKQKKDIIIKNNKQLLLLYETKFKKYENTENHLVEKCNTINELKQDIMKLKEEIEGLKNQKSILEFELQKKDVNINCNDNLLNKIKIELQVAQTENKNLNSNSNKLEQEILEYKKYENNLKIMNQKFNDITKENVILSKKKDLTNELNDIKKNIIENKIL